MGNDKVNVVVIGGGHGLSVILRGIKMIESLHLSAIVTVADDGGSTGRLRRQFHIPAMGDIRSVLISLAESETLLKTLMEYRFEESDEAEQQDIGGHNLGNLILTALTQSCGSFMESIGILSKVLNVRGEIIPATSQVITLYAKMADGTIVRGESNIPNVDNRIDTVFYQEHVKATEKAIEAIQQADIIIYGIGSIFTSIVPNLIIPEIQQAIGQSKAVGLYFCNVMSQPGETDAFSLEDHVETLISHGAKIHEVIVADDLIPQSIVKRYQQQGGELVQTLQQEHPYRCTHYSLLDFSHDLVRHDSEKIKKCFEEFLMRIEDEKCHLPQK